MQPMFIYITAKDTEQARSIGKTLVMEKLAACANIIDAMNSIFYWDGQLCDEREAVLICKTTSDLLDVLIIRVKQLHTYTTPCIVALPIIGGNGDYLDWIAAGTRKS